MLLFVVSVYCVHACARVCVMSISLWWTPLAGGMVNGSTPVPDYTRYIQGFLMLVLQANYKGYIMQTHNDLVEEGKPLLQVQPKSLLLFFAYPPF